MQKNSLIVMVVFLGIFIVPSLVFANEITPEKIELAKKLESLRPVKPQLDAAIQRFLRTVPEAQKQSLQIRLSEALNYKALKTVAIDAYAEVYSEEELQAMIDYYGSEAGQSASTKSSAYATKVYPHIIKMLDKAAMEMRTAR